MRAVAPSILAAALPETAAALKVVSAETEDDASSAAPMLRAAAICARLAGAALSAEDAELADMATFCDEVPKGIQRKITHAAEAVAHTDGIAAARPDDTTRAFLHSCDGRWVRCTRMFWLQLSNEEVVLRMQRYLRLPLSALAGIVGTLGLDKKQTLIGPLATSCSPATRRRRTTSTTLCC